MMQRVLLALCISFAFSSGIMLFLGRGAKAHGPATPELRYMALASDVELGQVITDADLVEVSWPVSRGLEGGLTARTQAGFLHPGSHVDVLVTCKLRADLDLSTVTALENAEVIATGQRSQPDPSGKPESVTVVTLLLTPENAERAVIAASQGSVHFVLRNNTDTEASAPNPMKLSSLAGTGPEPKVAAPRKAQNPPATRTPEPGIETVLDGSAPSADAGVRGTR